MQHLDLNRLSSQRLAIAALLLILAISTLSLIGKAGLNIYQLDRGDVLNNMHFAGKLHGARPGVPDYLHHKNQKDVGSLADGSGPSNESHMNAIAKPRVTDEKFLNHWYNDHEKPEPVKPC